MIIQQNICMKIKINGETKKLIDIDRKIDRNKRMMDIGFSVTR